MPINDETTFESYSINNMIIDIKNHGNERFSLSFKAYFNKLDEDEYGNDIQEPLILSYRRGRDLELIELLIDNLKDDVMLDYIVFYIDHLAVDTEFGLHYRSWYENKVFKFKSMYINKLGFSKIVGENMWDAVGYWDYRDIERITRETLASFTKGVDEFISNLEHMMNSDHLGDGKIFDEKYRSFEDASLAALRWFLEKIEPNQDFGGKIEI